MVLRCYSPTCCHSLSAIGQVPSGHDVLTRRLTNCWRLKGVLRGQTVVDARNDLFGIGPWVQVPPEIVFWGGDQAKFPTFFGDAIRQVPLGSVARPTPDEFYTRGIGHKVGLLAIGHGGNASALAK